VALAWSDVVTAVLRRLRTGRLTGVSLALVICCVYLAATQPAFLTWSNWQNIFRAQAVVAILAVGMTFVVLTGGVDLAVASITALTAVCFGLVIQDGGGWIAAAAVTFAVGAGVGLLNGSLIGYGGIPFFVVTLGALAIYQSLALVLSGTGESISLSESTAHQPIADLANGAVGPFPSALLVTVGLYLVSWLMLNLTPFGHRIYAVGANPVAAQLVGVAVNRVITAVYAAAGICYALGAIVQVGRLNAAAPVVDPTLLLDVIAAVLIGGVAFSGGAGSVLGTAVGVLFLGVVENGLSLSGVTSFWQGIVSGIILIGAVGIGVLRDNAWLSQQAQVARRSGRRLARRADSGSGP
jgi:ribose/xylose/arabinose/galactoside ABC-type transport system permease subunit